jgi:hypothetical protein
VKRRNLGNAVCAVASATGTTLCAAAAGVYAIAGKWWTVVLFAVLYLAGIWATASALNKWLTEALAGWSITAIIRHIHEEDTHADH